MKSYSSTKTIGADLFERLIYSIMESYLEL